MIYDLDLDHWGLDEIQAAAQAALNMLAALPGPYPGEAHMYECATSVGSRVYPADGATSFDVEFNDGGQIVPAYVDLLPQPGGGFAVSVDCPCWRTPSAGNCIHVRAALPQIWHALTAILRTVDRASAAPSSRPAAWRQGLSRLDSFLAASTPTQPEEVSQRVVWRVARDDLGDLAVIPYVQQRGKRGAFSKGRKISLSKLAKDESLWTRAEVRAVATCYQEHEAVVSYLRFQWSAREIEAGRLLVHLVGSPYVYWYGQEDEQVRVREERVTLSLRERGEDELELEWTLGGHPIVGHAYYASNSETIVVADVERDELIVARLDEDVRGLLVHDDPSERIFPLEARDELLTRLELLEARLPVDVPESLRVPPQPADPRLRLLLAPTPSGLQVEARTRPLPNTLLVPGCGDREVGAWQGGRRATVRRDLFLERTSALALLEGLGLDVDDERIDEPRGWTWQLQGDAALDLLAALNDADPEALVPEWPEGARVSVSREVGLNDLRVKIDDRRDWFGVNGKVEVDGKEITLVELLKAVDSGGRYLPLEGGRWLRVSSLLRERLAALRDVSHTRGKHLEVGATAASVVQDLLDDAAEVDYSAAWKELRARVAKAGRVSTKPPRSLRATLRPYQLEGFAWLKRLSTWGVGACLADDMGLGKTIQAIAVLLTRKAEGPALVVAPTSVGANWIRELERFAPSLVPVLYRDERKKGLADLDDLSLREQGKRVVVINYDLARIDIAALDGIQWGTLIFDEAQRVKNGNSKTARALRDLNGKWRLALTGTPVENHLGDLWSLFRLISPGVFGSWDSFKNRFALPIERDSDDERRVALAQVIRPFVLRRTKAEVLPELNERTDMRLEVDLSKQEATLYRDARLAALADLDGEEKGNDRRFRILAALTKLRQLACHPSLVDASWEGSSAKLEAFLELVDDLRAGGHRALVFSQFTSHLAIVRAALDERGIKTLYLDGSTPAAKRQPVVDAFQQGDAELFLISLKAGGTGLNLTAADYVIHLDPWWNPAAEDQATDRAHRIGQTKTVTVYRIVAKNTIEEQILELHADKRDLVAGVLEGTNRAGKLSTEDLMGCLTR